MKLLQAFLFSALVFAMARETNAQVIMPSGQSTSIRQNVFGLGFFGGASGGIGLSFRHHLPSPLSYQITGGIIKTDNVTSGDDLDDAAQKIVKAVKEAA